MARIFISHAHEDKVKFARPLALALKKNHEVWFDEFELKVGDSLRERIDDGLHKCDFGVVILSAAFFRKKWTQAELDGLLALETKNRKLILPVWLGVSVEDVKQFSPTLAGRVGADAANGVDSVVSELLRAVQLSERTVEVATPQRSRSALKHLMDTLEAADNETALLGSHAGVAAVVASASEIASVVTSLINDTNKNSSKPRFNVEHHVKDQLTIYGPYFLGLQAGLRNIYLNTAERATFGVRLSKFDSINRFSSQLRWEGSWRPRFKSGSLVWAERNDHSTITYSNDEVATQIVERFTACVHNEKHLADQERDKERFS